MKRLALALTFAAIPAFAATSVDLYIYRTGNAQGSTNQINTGNNVWIDVWSASGENASYVKSIDTGIFASGTATSEGQLNFSADSKYLAFTGYATTHTSSLAGSNSSTINRTVGVLDVTTDTIVLKNFSDFSSGNNPRAAVTTTGTDLWMVGGAGGVRSSTDGSAASTQLSTTVTNLRNVDIVNGQLYVSGSSGSAVRLGAVGTATPTTTGQTISNLPGFPTSGSPYDFFFANDTTLYVADDSAGIQKYTLSNAAWTLAGAVTASGVRGLTGVVDSDGVRLYGTTGGSSATGTGTVYTFLDAVGSTAFSGTASTLLTQSDLQDALGSSGSNFAFRGIELTAIPEPSTYALVLGGLTLGFIALRRRRD